MERGDMYIYFLVEKNLAERENSEETGVDGRMILQWIFMKWLGGWIGLFWLKVGISGELLLIR
jgi:hypothetical protein